MLELHRLITQTISPDRSVGQLLLSLRMHWATLPMRFSRGDVNVTEFIRLCKIVIPKYSMLSVDRLHSLFQLSLDAAQRGVPGAIVECGTWNGGAAAMMAAATTRGGLSRDVWLYNSFEELPPPTANDPKDAHDAYFKGWCSGSPGSVREVLRSVGLSDDKTHIVKGWFETTLPDANVGPVALLHVDSDWYQSVHQCLDAFYDAVVLGGVIIFDDYELWAGCKKAVDEFLHARGEANELQSSGRVARYLVRR
jgi:O-methyltransferase